jgi:hypothetical protein
MNWNEGHNRVKGLAWFLIAIGGVALAGGVFCGMLGLPLFGEAWFIAKRCFTAGIILRGAGWIAEGYTH